MKEKLGWNKNELESLVRQLGVALEASGLGIWHHNLRKNETLWDMQLQAIYGITKQLLEVAWLNCVHPEDRATANATFQNAITKRTDYVCDFRIIRPDGSIRYLRSWAKFFIDPDGDPCFVGAELDRTNDALKNQQLAFEREAAEKSRNEARHAADHDYLTGLMNRRAFDAVLASSAEAVTDEFLGLCHLDLDRFKDINDRFGHAGGDAALKHVGTILSEVAGPTEIAVRLGGDEFAIFTRHIDPDRISSLAIQLKDALLRPITFDGQSQTFLECSMGLAVKPASDSDGLMQCSDAALYLAKKNGRNRIEHYSIALAMQLLAEKQKLFELKEAVATGQFVPYYQVQVDAKDHSIIGMEALARWRHPSGIRPPSEFIPLATEHHLIEEIDHQILLCVIADIQAWEAEGLEVPRISVNLSADRLSNPRLVEQIAELEIPSEKISFELVETIFLDTLDDCIEANLRFIRNQKIHIEIDDLGSGHASLIGLIQLRPNRVKIDRHLVLPIIHSSAQKQLIAALVDFARALQIEVLAEGVETIEYAEILRALGVDFFQGYVFGHPEPAIEVSRRLAPKQRFCKAI